MRANSRERTSTLDERAVRESTRVRLNTMFKLVSTFKPTGDQPQAIKQLLAGLKKGLRHQTLLGVTGSGKTFTMANVIAKINKPTLIISHNKTLAAQLFQEFRAFFPEKLGGQRFVMR